MNAALPSRLPLALDWFGYAENDSLLDAGIRSVSMADARKLFVKEVLGKLVTIVDISDAELAELMQSPQVDDYDPVRRRTQGTSMPDSLWEFMVPTSDEAKLARRPLAVSIEDNIDLW